MAELVRGVPSHAVRLPAHALLVTQTIVRGVALLAITVGCFVLLGWVVGSPLLKGAIATPITMKANTAICFVLVGTALWFSVSEYRARRQLGRVFAFLIAVLGGLTLSEYVTGLDAHIDQLFFAEPLGEAATASPGRMGPPAALSFLTLGVSLLLLDFRTRKGRFPFRYAPLLVTGIALIASVGYAVGSPILYSQVPVTGIAWPTAVTLFFVSLAVLAARPENSVVQVLCASNAGGMAARRLLIPAIVIPFGLLALYNIARESDWVDASLGRGMLAVLMMLALTGVVLLTSARLCTTAEEQTRAERELVRSQKDLTDLFENAAVGLHLVDAEGIILRANRADRELLGYSREDYIGHHIAEFHVDKAVIDDILRRLHAGEELQDYPARMRCKDGTIKDVLIDSSVLWENGEFIHSRCFIRDVTDRRSAEVIGRRLSAIVQSSNDAIIGKNLDGTVTDWNRAAEEMFGYTAEEIVGKPIITLIPADHIEEEANILRRLRAGEKVEIYDTIRRRKDGQLIHVSLSISPIIDSAGVVIGAAKIARDITERKRTDAERESLLESERAARGEAERASRLRDEFLAIVSHELRTPLNSILGWVHLLKRNPSAPEILTEAIASIERGARTQVQLVEDLLDMNRIMTGKLPLDVGALQLPAVIDAAIATVRPAADSKGIQVRTVLDTRAGPVMGDPVRLQQVIWNLLSNAVKFTPKGGRVEVVLRPANSHLEIVVSDTGIGIKPDFLPYVFERFRQADSSTTRMYGGLGLGLAIVKQLVELHGGTVTAISEGEGKGASFSIKLPLAAVRSPSQSASPENLTLSHEVDAVDLANVRILVVDDDSEARELVRRVLSNCNAEVLTAGSGAEALEILQREPINMLVSDIGMPQMDGYQFIRKVRDLPFGGGRSIPAVAVTAYARSEDRTRAMLAGYQTHISKPIEPHELVATVASFAGRTNPLN